MKIKAVVLAVLLLFVPGSMLAGCGGADPAAIETIEALPAAEWQVEVTFPDWRENPSATTAINNRIGFYSYSGQGDLYLVNDGCEAFDLYVNDRQVKADVPADGTPCRLDISGVTGNGLNSLQVSGIKSGEVHVFVPYPVVIEGTPEDVGVSQASLDLIDAIISADVEHGFPGAQLAIIKDGRLIYQNEWGSVQTYDETGAPVAAPASVTAETLFDLASNTKMYSVNYAIQYLLSRGEIDLDTKVVDILGDGFAEDTIKIDYEGREAVPLETHKAWKAELTLRDLLLHQSGFPPGPNYYSDRYECATQDFDSDAGNVTYVGTGADAAAREETLLQICRTPLMYEPGTEAAYSDVDYMVLCYCIEKITGKRLDEYLSNVFWDPMGLTHICYNPLENGFSKEDCAATELAGNTRDNRLHYTGIRTELIQGEAHDPIAYYCMDGVSGHAGMFASAADLAMLGSVMLTGGYGEHRYFTRDVIDLFTTPGSQVSPQYGLGWWYEGDHNWDSYFGSVSDPSTYGHQGFTGTLTMIDPDENLVVVLLTNKLHTDMQEDDETLSRWNGNYYTTGTLGFVPAILEIGMNGEADRDVYRSLLTDMLADMERSMEESGITDPDHPQQQAYEALESVLEGLE